MPFLILTIIYLFRSYVQSPKALIFVTKTNKGLARSYKTSTGFYLCAFISTKSLGIKKPNVANRVVSNFLRSLAGVQVKEANISLFLVKKIFLFFPLPVI